MVAPMQCIEDLMEVIKQQIISICEVGAEWWGPQISYSENNVIEWLLKTSLHIVFQNHYVSFKHALLSAKLINLKERRKIIISSFSKKCY